MLRVSTQALSYFVRRSRCLQASHASIAARFSTSSVPSQPSVVDLSGVASTTGAPVVHVPIESWSGPDVKVVLHKSLEEMVPTGMIALPGLLFNAPVRPDLVHRTVTWQLAKRRAGTAKAKNRSEVSGSGRKVRPQKGSGRSRQGARTSPIFRGGGRVHGPVPRSFDFPLQLNVRRNALRSVLTSKVLNGQLWIVNEVTIADAKTRSMVTAMDKYAWSSALIIDNCEDDDAVSGVHPSLYRASNSIKKTLAMNVRGINCYDALSFNHLVISTKAIEHLTKRFEAYEWLY